MRLLLTCILLVCVTSAAVAPVAAEPPQKQDTLTLLIRYCKNYLKENKFKSSEIDSACSEGKMTRLRDATSNYDKIDYNAQDVASLIEAQAESFLRQAYDTKPKPKNAKEFNKALDKIYDKYDLDASSPNPAANISKSETNDITDPAADPNAKCDDQCDIVKKYVNPGINLLSIIFGLIVIASLIMGGIQYSASEGDPQKVTKGKQRISNTIMALVAYMFLYAFLQFLIPGGLFNR